MEKMTISYRLLVLEESCRTNLRQFFILFEHISYVLILYRSKSAISNKYFIIGILFSVIAIGLFSLSVYLFLEHQQCAPIWDKIPPPPYLGGGWCDAIVESSHNILILGVGMSSVAITMLVIYYKKW